MTYTAQELSDILSDGRIFSITFIKRTTGELRLMHARRGVKAHLKGGTLPYDPIEKGLVTVYDLDKEAYRTIPAENVTEIRHHGKKETFA